MTSLVENAVLLKGFNFLRFCSFSVPVPIEWREEVGTARPCSPGHGHVGGSQLMHFFDRCGDFKFNEHDLVLTCSREVDLNDQPTEIMVSHPKVRGLSWVIFFYQTEPNQYQPRIAYEFPRYLRGACEVCIQFAVLPMNSPWFYERFRHAASLNCGDVGLIVSIPFDFECVQNFLHFIHPNTDFQIGPLNMEGLMDMEKGYQIPYVIRQCEKFLYKYMEGGSAVLAYYLDHKHELPALQDAALLRLAELNSSQLRSRIALDMKDKTADTQEILLNDLL
ncbi:unnamed protein product [Taenia asiatica]|uniref:BTB domain-containing protein n=1 Tax=Taenia asiatica TaxID=60517 RepID=A0A0R3WCW1_TAEAS|nr:unnamed protein product [Taenia asiatica]